MLINRHLRAYLDSWLRRPKSLLLWGPRQTGKTTLIQEWLRAAPSSWEKSVYALQNPSLRQRIEAEPGIVREELAAGGGKKRLVFIDEVQKVPAIMDLVQQMADETRGRWKFILTGSSARKIRAAGGNLLPGRVFAKRLDPLLWSELGWAGEGRGSVSPVEAPVRPGPAQPPLRYSFDQAMVWGTLPEIPGLSPKDRTEVLRSYSSLYIEQEIRAEALVRNLGAFHRFLEIAARGSGDAPNLTRLSQETGVSLPTVKEYYAILEETFLVERVEPFLRSSRKRLTAAPRYYFFDTGVRNAAARLPLDPGILSTEGGRLFEHAVLHEILRRIRLAGLPWTVHYWRTSHGAEVDIVVDTGGEVIPIEVKSGARVRSEDLSGLKRFLDDYPRLARRGWVVFNGPAPRKISDKITALPWGWF